MELLGCGVPLLIEKPLALTRREANELVAWLGRKASCCRSATSSDSIRP